MASAVWRNARFFLIEPNEAHSSTLAKTGWPYSITLVGETRKNVSMNVAVAGVGTGNSLFKEESSSTTATATPVWSSRWMTMTTLDELLSAHRVPQPQLLKLDVQGIVRGVRGHDAR